MKILVTSCDKSFDTFEPFHYCMEKYWPEHPEVIYSTETIDNPYYKTIKKNYDLNHWTVRIRECVSEIDDTQILMMCDDMFIRKPVNKELIDKIQELVNGSVAAYNLQAPFDNNNLPFNDFTLKRPTNGQYKTSLMCQLWQKDKLLKCFEGLELDPWKFELLNKHYDFDYLISKNGEIINWGRPIKGGSFGIRHGKWTTEVKEFFKKEGIYVDYSKRGSL